MYEESTAELHNDLIVAVRGKLTLERIAVRSGAHSNLSVIQLGDPGLITSLAFPHKKPTDPETVLFIPHVVDRNSPELQQLVHANPEIKVLDVTGDPRKLCAEISQARIVLSSALHPLVVADSYGVPNVRVILSDRVHGGNFKFRDYYSVFDAPVPEQFIEINSLMTGFDSQIEEAVKQYERLGIERIITGLLESLPRAIRLAKK
jgi:hypothetical protein